MEAVRKKLLFISSQLPFPPLSGGVIKSFKLLEYFSNHYQTTLACPLKFDDAEHIGELQHMLPNLTILARQTQIERNAFNWLQSMLHGKTMNEWRSFNKRLYNDIQEVLNEADIVFIDHYEVFQYLPPTLSTKVVLHTHNAEGQIWHRYAAITSNVLKRQLIRLESKRIEQKEKLYAQKADLVLAAPADINYLKTAQAAPFIPTYHLGNDHLLNLPNLNYAETENTLMYVGTLTWEANVDGLLWFKRNVWPQLTANNSTLEFVIIGKNPDERLLQWANNDNQVRVTGFVPDLEPYYQKARLFMVPLRFGSGMKVKILDAFYRGLPVATTGIGMESIDAFDNEHALVEDDANLLGEKILNLMGNQKDWERISVNSRLLAKEKYTWLQHLKNLHNAIEQL